MKTQKIGLFVAALVIWLASAGSARATPSGIIPPACKSLAGHANLLLPCYLNDPSDSDIAFLINWCFSSKAASCLSWSQWPTTAKDALVLAFVRTVDWYNNGMTTYAGPLPPDPPPNPDQFNFSISPAALESDLDPNDAFAIYIGHLAVSLAAEIYQWVPWGLHDYFNNSQALETLIDGEFLFSRNPTNGLVFPIVLDATPGNAINTFKFLKTNNLIGTTRVDTIGRVLDWARNNLEHFDGAFSPQNFFYNWQYWGFPPISKIIQGTPNLDPQWQGTSQALPHHWTAGCPGTSAFLAWVLRVVNIPVQPVGVAGHTAPWFVSEDLYLSHGDDPYNALSKAGYPATELLVSLDDYEAWFGPNNSKPISESDQNVGRRPVDLAVQFPTSNWILFRYCDDLANNRDHASGRVYNETFNVVNSAYTVTDLEVLGLWDRLAVAKTTLGCPATPY